MAFLIERQSADLTPFQFGKSVAINCTTTVQVLDLTSLPADAWCPSQPDHQNVVSKFIRITADGGTIYYAVGSNFTQLNSIPNTVLYSTVNTTTGKVTIQGNEVGVIPSTGSVDFYVVPGVSPQSTVRSAANPNPGSDSPCRYVALLTASGSAIARIHQASR